MTIRMECPRCRRILRAPDEAAARTVSCPSCQGRVRFPAAELAAPQEPVQEFTISAGTSKASAGDLDFEAPPEPRPVWSYPPPPEPWYYNFTAKFLGGIVFIGCLLAAICIIVGFYIEGEQSVVDIMLRIAVALFVLFVTGLVTAPGLIFLDMARNIRAMRYETQAMRNRTKTSSGHKSR